MGEEVSGDSLYFKNKQTKTNVELALGAPGYRASTNI